MQKDFSALLSHFEYGNTKRVLTKLQALVDGGADKLHMLLDFDRTLTVSQSGEDDVTTWQILQKHLPPEGQMEYRKLYEQYRPLELSGTMTENDAVVWWEKVLQLFIKYSVNLREVERDFLHTVALRPYTKELFDLCHSNNIPPVILSAGIKDVIDLFLRQYGIEAALTMSTELTLDNRGMITGWRKDSLIHSRNKRESGHAELELIRDKRPLCILVGDSMDDADMVEGDDSVLRIVFLNHRNDDKKAQMYALSKFDLIAKEQSMQGIVELLSLLIR